MMGRSCCQNYSAADDGCASRGRHRPSLHRAGWVGAASWPTRLVPGVRQLFGAGLIELEDDWNCAIMWPFTPAVLTNSIFQPAPGHAIMILLTVHGRTVWRCGSVFWSS